MKYELDVDEHVRVGPYTDMYGHGPVTIVGDLFVCLDCGYVAEDNRLFAHERCDRRKNPINMTWRERLEKRGFPEAGVGGWLAESGEQE